MSSAVTKQIWDRDVENSEKIRVKGEKIGERETAKRREKGLNKIAISVSE